MKRFVLSVFALVAISACAVSQILPMTVPLAYQASPKNLGLLGGLTCRVVSVEASDARTQQTLGTRVHESKPQKADVTAGSDPAAWVADGVRSVLGQNGFATQGAGPTLRLSLESLHTVESVWHRWSYDARLTMDAELRSAAGKACWKGSVEGQGGNYGYAGSIPNYQETLNAALDSATSNMILAAGFKDALCHCTE